jgi:hypothetical protein
MKRELTWILAAKLAALGILWVLFFSGAHRVAVDAPATSRQLGIAPMPGAGAGAGSEPEPDPRSRPQERTGD